MTALDPEMAEALAINAGLQPPGDRDRLPWDQQRQIFEATRRYWNDAPLDVAEVRNDRLFGGMAVRRYSCGAQGAPKMVYLHGGGWTLGSLDSHDNVSRSLCHHGGLDVVSLDYPLAPETTCNEMVGSIAQAVREIAHDNAAPIALTGDSAGAHLAILAAGELSGNAPKVLFGLVSIYGALSQADLPSMRTFGDGRYGLSAARMALYWQALGVSADPAAVDAPLPPALVIAAECDVLRDASLHFADARSARGDTVELVVEPGMAHAFMGYGRHVSRVAKVSEQIGAFLRSL